ncbi:MAG: peptidylprolyl isomerase [Anaerolineaceae bacterium]|nr:peptidylprolyl isomerase [Anaerolineaceae bacterium]
MDTQKHPNQVADDVVVSIDYSLTVEGQVIDSTEGDEPLQFLQGHQNIIPGLEKELSGMKVGDNKKVVVSPEEAYGEIDPENIIEVPREEFPDDIPLEPGTELEVKNADGEVLSATIAEISSQIVKLDFNHPLAGKQLTFDVTIVELRDPTEEELSHGHIHFEDDLDFEEEDYEEYEEEDDDELEYEDIDDEEEDDALFDESSDNHKK